MSVASPKQAMKRRPDAVELRPDELIQLRRLLREAPTVDTFLTPAQVAERLGLNKRTVLELARAGEFDGKWGKAFRLDHNCVRIPMTGIEEFQRKHALAAAA